jgi:putative drug exporter of the RND superfamily
MSRLKSMVGIPAGRRTKWLVLVFWLVVVALAGPLSGKLTGVEKNDAQSWLPSAAESTQALALRSCRPTSSRPWWCTTGRLA